jgi:hypothetical protein
MSNTPALPSATNSLSRSNSLHIGESISPMEAIALSDDRYSKQVLRYVHLKMEEWVKVELLGAILTAVFLSGLSVLQGGFTWYAFLAALVGFCAVIIAFAIAFTVNAPGELHATIRERLTQKEKLLEPKLTISLVPHPVPNETPFYEKFTGDDGELWELYRIAMTSSVPTIAWLKVREVMLNGHRRYNVHLHYMHAETRVIRVEMAPDEPEYWDVAQKHSQMDHALLTHIKPQLGYDLPAGEQQFEIIASGRDGPVTTKIVMLKIDNEKKLHLELRDPVS